MKKPLIKALGVILSAALIFGSVPASVLPAMAEEAPTETAASSEVSFIDTGVCRRVMQAARIPIRPWREMMLQKTEPVKLPDRKARSSDKNQNSKDCIEIALTQKMAMIFEIAGKQQKNPYVFTTKFIASKTYDDLFTFLPGEIEQSPLCEYKMFLQEMEEKHICIPELDKEIEYDYMFWLGYLLTYWGYLKKTHPAKIIKRYDVVRIIGAYETLHTLKTEIAIDFIMREYCKDKK